MNARMALATLFACGFLQAAQAQEQPSTAPAPVPTTAAGRCPDGMTPAVRYVASDLQALRPPQLEARLREVAARVAADPQVRRQLACLMQR